MKPKTGFFLRRAYKRRLPKAQPSEAQREAAIGLWGSRANPSPPSEKIDRVGEPQRPAVKAEDALRCESGATLQPPRCPAAEKIWPIR